jgi:hypothetical protein
VSKLERIQIKDISHTGSKIDQNSCSPIAHLQQLSTDYFLGAAVAPVSHALVAIINFADRQPVPGY